jgi:V-type H+-transporting ATPase subunit H
MENKEHKENLVNLLLKISKSPSTNSKILLYVFARIANILDIYNNASDISNKDNNSLILFPHGIIDNDLFLNGLNNVDITLQKISALCYAYCLPKCSSGEFNSIVTWCINNLSYTSNVGFEDVIPVLVSLFKSEQARDVFLQNGGLILIINLIKKIGANGNAQQLYELTFLVWTLALVSDKYINIFLSSGIIPNLVDILSAAPSRKVVRMTLATLRHLSNSENDVILNEMLTAQLDKILANMISTNTHKQAGDLEVEADCQALSEILTKNYRELSTFDRWASEVQSGALRWGIVHTEKFWRENNKFVEANDFQLLKNLIVLLSSEDSVSFIYIFINFILIYSNI